MRPQDLIAKKRDGGVFSPDEVAAFIRGVVDGSWADYQISALIMAIFIRGFNGEEQEYLVKEMLYSGEVLDLSDIDRPKADKHSTGGVGDKTSLIIAPLAAACGLAVPMISGRGLGHTGGTLDKLESIPGYRVGLQVDEFKQIIRDCGFAMSGQTAEVVPADKKLYALRDATATVPYIPLIVGSIMSKKLAEGLNALVLDVKTGNGAFMETPEKAEELASAMCAAGNSFGVRTEAVISDMSQPLGQWVGNAVEVYECIKIMRREMTDEMRPTLDLSLDLTGRMVVLAGLAGSIEEANAKCLAKLEDGTALDIFRRNVELQDGVPEVCDSPEMLFVTGMVEIPVKASRWGYISSVDTKAVGNAVSEIGGGRAKAEDSVDHAVAFRYDVKIGDQVEPGDLIGMVYARDASNGTICAAQIAEACQINDEKPQSPQLISKIIA